jgi:hypothetical protein
MNKFSNKGLVLFKYNNNKYNNSNSNSNNNNNNNTNNNSNNSNNNNKIGETLKKYNKILIY